ncbi:MAG: hypothetical protein JWM09_237 [Francisellaceae bacterium]|nr:hypothetical protein [Francisellaceae bacterium]
MVVYLIKEGLSVSLSRETLLAINPLGPWLLAQILPVA